MFIATQLNSTQLNSTARLWRHKQKHDWLASRWLADWLYAVQLGQFSWVELCRYKRALTLAVQALFSGWGGVIGCVRKVNPKCWSSVLNFSDTQHWYSNSVCCPSVCLSVCLFVRLSRSGFVSKRQYIIILSSTHGSLNHSQYWTPLRNTDGVYPLRRHWMQVGYINFALFSNLSQVFPPREKLSTREKLSRRKIYDSGCHYLCPVSFPPRETA